MNKQLLDKCLDFFIQNPKFWDQRGYIRNTTEGTKFCLAALVVMLSGRAVPRGEYWVVNGGTLFHETAQSLLGITDDQANWIFSAQPYFDELTPEQFKQFVYERLEL